MASRADVTCVALMGNPRAVFLDEPTTGMVCKPVRRYPTRALLLLNVFAGPCDSPLGLVHDSGDEGVRVKMVANCARSQP